MLMPTTKAATPPITKYKYLSTNLAAGLTAHTRAREHSGKSSRTQTHTPGHADGSTKPRDEIKTCRTRSIAGSCSTCRNRPLVRRSTLPNTRWSQSLRHRPARRRRGLLTGSGFGAGVEMQSLVQDCDLWDSHVLATHLMPHDRTANGHSQVDFKALSISVSRRTTDSKPARNASDGVSVLRQTL